jgi:signal transduction histidine kinase
MPERAVRPARGSYRILRGLRAQLLLWTILPLAFVLVLLSLAGVTRHRQAMTQLVEDRDRGLITAEANRLGRDIAQRTADVSRIGATLPVNSPPLGLVAFLDRADTGGLGLALLDKQGALQAASPAAATWAGGPSARILAARTAAVEQPQYETDAPGSDDARLLIGVPVASGDTLVGALPLVALRLNDTSLLVAGEAQGPLWVLDQTGRAIHHHGSEQATPDESILAGTTRTGSGSQRVRDQAGQDLLVSYAHVEPVGWVILTTENIRAVSSMGVSVVEVLPALLLFVALTALLAVSLGVLNIVRPLQELDRRAAKVAWGDFDAIERPVGGIQEIEDLRATLSHMAERIRSYQGGMRDYLSAITRGQEDERERLAHELHDVTIQGLIALKQRSQLALKASTRDPVRARERLQELGGLIDTEIAALRHIISDLRPIYLEDLGFVPALEMLARQTQEHHHLAVHLAVKGDTVRLSPDLELAAYRIVQQAVTNVATHARAANAWVDVEFAPDALCLAVRDDGVGFTPPEQPADLVHQGHFGLMGMRERALLYGGQLTITSADGQGARVVARLPLG